jgi:H(+)-translocating pyrophosphatase
MDLYYSGEKSKDVSASKILSIYNKLSEREWFNIKVSCVLVPLVLVLISSYLIKELTIVAIVAVNLFSIVSIIYAIFILIEILNKETGNERMMEIADAIREGSEGFFMTQYTTIFQLSLVFGVAIFLFYLGRDLTSDQSLKEFISPNVIALFIVFSFFMGALCSAISGYTGMWVSVRANIRVAAAAMKDYNEALQLCFNGGLFAAIINVALAIFGISSIFLSIYFVMSMNTVYESTQIPYDKIPLLLVGFSFGASFVAMFAQLGGGIYTKAADVGADLIGKIEMGFQEDDARNPAVIADLVGDNVGDCAGQAADLFESISAEVISAMILGCELGHNIGSMNSKGGFIIFPLVIHCLDLFVSCIGAKFVSTKKGLPSMGLGEYSVEMEDPLVVMKKGYRVSVAFGVVGVFVTSYFLLNIRVKESEYGWLYFAGCGLIGIIDAYLFIIITQLYTDYNFSSVKSIALSSQTGHATNIISGLAVGLESTAAPTILIAMSLIGSYALGQQSNIIQDEKKMHLAGLYGTAVATMGMFVSGVFILSMSGFGPIADNAGGIVEMSVHDESVRAITDRLDAVGNVTKANTKGYSVGSAALACFLLFAAFTDEVALVTGIESYTVDIAQVEIFIAGLIGSAVVFLFSSLALNSVGVAAQSVIKEVRNQIKNDEGIMKGTSKPNYKQCVAIVTKAGLKEMIKPGLLSVLSPIVVGLVFMFIGKWRNKPLLGAHAVSAFLMFSTSTGILMALFFNNAGGAWDNAKKYIETGALGGKHSETHKAAVTGDTVGDPCKDTAGPSIHILIKLVSTITLVLAPLFIPSELINRK